MLILKDTLELSNFNIHKYKIWAFINYTQFYFYVFTGLLCIILASFTLLESNINNLLFKYLLEVSDLLNLSDDIILFIYTFFISSLGICFLFIFFPSITK